MLERGGCTNSVFAEFLERRRSVHLTFMIDATDDCQLRCRYCYFGRKGKKMMNIEAVLDGASNTVGVFRDKIRSVEFHYMGGEPLLAWREILALNANARRRFEEIGVEFRWSLTSNLVALDEAKAEHMVRESASIHCSIDGPPRIHDRNRPFESGATSFEQVASHVPLR